MRKVFLDRIFHHFLMVSVSSPLVSGVSTLCGLWDGPCFSLSSTSFSSVNRKTYIVHQTRKLLNPIEANYTNYSLRETAVVLSPPHKRSDTRTRSDDHWHELQWQQDRWRTDLKGTKCGKNLESTWNNTINFLIWTQILASSDACSNNSRLRHRLWTASRTSCWGPQPTVPGSW